MENQSQNSGRRLREQSASPSSRRSLKRKLEEEYGEDRVSVGGEDRASVGGEDRASVGGESPAASQQDLIRDIKAQVEILDAVFSAAEQDRASAKHAIHVLSELAKNEDMVNLIVDCAAVPVLVKHLQAPPPLGRDGEGGLSSYEHEVEKGSAFTLGLLAIKVNSSTT